MEFYRKIYLIVIAFVAIVLAGACTEITDNQDFREQEQRFFDLYVSSNYPTVQPESSGIYFIEHKAGTGAVPDADDWLLVNHVCYTIPEDKIYESYVENVAIDNLFYNPIAIYGPYKMQNGSRNDGLKEGLLLMSEGAQATIFFTSDLGFGSSGSGDVPAYQSLKYEIELLEVIKDIDVYEQAKIDSYLDTIPQYDTIHDPNSDAIMYYIIDEASDGAPVVNDSLVQVAYRGYLLDGREFDQRTADDPFEITAGKDVIAGWDLGLLKLHEGEKARFIIPYQLGYGEEGSIHSETGLRAIPPYETLLFDIEIISVEENPDADD